MIETILFIWLVAAAINAILIGIACGAGHMSDDPFSIGINILLGPTLWLFMFSRALGMLLR